MATITEIYANQVRNRANGPATHPRVYVFSYDATTTQNPVWKADDCEWNSWIWVCNERYTTPGGITADWYIPWIDNNWAEIKVNNWIVVDSSTPHAGKLLHDCI